MSVLAKPQVWIVMLVTAALILSCFFFVVPTYKYIEGMFDSAEVSTAGLEIGELTFVEQDVTYLVEVAETEAERAQGLSGRLELPEGTGMIFLMSSLGQHGFWMPDMHFPLDMLWIHKGEVVYIEENVPNPEPGALKEDLPTYFPDTPATVVLEIPAGDCEKYEIEVGDLTVLER